ncbi:MAG: ABC transporter ATP-binding protein [Firmicutes bacterium]|nr:ABC transporter ATP-binding protein [Bacillota bacterium]
MLRINNLVKLYPNSKRASVFDISLKLKPGEICGFLGMNGAGKSTTLKCLTGIIPCTYGRIEICGYDITKKPFDAKMNFGFVPDNHAVYDKLTGKEYVNYMADLYKVSKAERKNTFEKFIYLFNLEHAVDNQISSYSHGMKQKICIIAALIHNPKLWILDEPMVGLDPQSIFEVKEYMKEHVKGGNSVFFSSHSLDTVERLCDRAIIINGGVLLDDINLTEYRKKNISLEEKFLKLTKTADEKLKKQADLQELEEAELIKKFGRKKARKIMIKKVKKNIEEYARLHEVKEYAIKGSAKDLKQIEI